MANLPPKFQDWLDARRRHRLSHAHVQMARELGMKPRQLGKIDNHRQEPWKVPEALREQARKLARAECPDQPLHPRR